MLPVVSTPQLVRELMYSEDIPEEKLMRYFEKIGNESYFAYLGIMGLELPNPRKVKTPLLVLGAGNDAFITPKQVQKTAAKYKAELEIYPGMAHNMMLEKGWEQVANRIIGWLDARGL